ncbi:MAG: site-specific integrase [Clostridium sp.]|nr:site-specific integrase [Clostridium sp.]
MATPKKLPSGNWRIQVYDYTDVYGKKHYKSFTAPSKNQVKLMAAEWEAGKVAEDPDNINLFDAIENYLKVKEGVLSPSTIRGYVGLHKNYFTGPLGQKRLKDLTNTAVQIWVGDLSSKVSSKTVRNAYGLLSATLEMFYPDFRLKATLPAKQKPELYCPSDEDVKTLLRHIQGTELEVAVLLAAFGPLRRGEICALTSDDLEGKTVIVRKSMVKDSEGAWHIKEPKTYGSYRKVELPDFVIEKISQKKGKIVKMNPDYVTHRFGRVLKTLDIPHFRFHDLRHYAASIMHAIGVPDQYILQRGGWASDNVMKTVYRNTIDLETVRQTKKINQHFEALSK